MLAQIQAMFAVVDLGKINWNQFLEKYLEIAMSIIGKVIVSFLIIAIGFKLIKILIKLLKTTLEKAEIDYGVISFSCSFIRIGLRCIVIFMAVAHMGVEVSSFIALLGSAGVAVGLALQGTLSNHACERCGGDSALVYYTEKGDCYHSQASCSGLKRTVRLVKKSEIQAYIQCERCRENAG